MIAFLVESMKVLILLMLVSIGFTSVVFGVMMMLDKEWEIVDKMLAVTAILCGLTLINLIIVMMFN